MVTLRDVLSAPFVLRCETVSRDDGSWTRVVSYPELGLHAEGPETMGNLLEVELLRLRTLITAVEGGSEVPPLRPPIHDDRLEDLLDRAGLGPWIERLDEEVTADRTGS